MDENNNRTSDGNDSPPKRQKKNTEASTTSEEVSSMQHKRHARQTVFEFDSTMLFELLLSHGFPDAVCDTFLKNSIDGVFLKSLLKYNDCTKLKTHLNGLRELKESKLNDQQARHLLGILKKYKIHPYDSKDKIVADMVHGQMSVHPLLMKIVDTPQFQRLRYIKQLGCLSHVYPTGNHTRFEHSIGTSHIAGLFMEHLSRQRSLHITNADKLCVQIAGLCHDLGHGPFSHMFEEVIERLCPNTEWKHEMATLQMLDKILTETDNLKVEFEAYGLFEHDVQFIKDLIYAPTLKSARGIENYTKELKVLESLKSREGGVKKSFLFEIISNYRNGIDVDKFDYFERDSKQMGFKNNFNYERYINSTRVISSKEEVNNDLNQICVYAKGYGDLYELFHVREKLTRNAYKHHTGSSINLMFVDALVKSDKYFEFSKMIENEDIDAFEKLTDSVEEIIRHSSDHRLKESREILESVSRRKLYKFSGMVVLPDIFFKSKDSNVKIIKEELIKYFEGESNNEINSENVAFEIVRFNYGSKNKNPIENVRFWDWDDRNKASPIEKERISGMLIKQFEDVEVRVYSKKLEIKSKVHELFKQWCKKHDLSMPLYGKQ